MADRAMAGLRVAVTGATGFIGAGLVPALVAAGAEVTAILRTGHEAGRISRAGARPVVAPLHDAGAMTRALSGAEALVHLAYDVRAGGGENLRAFDGLIAGAGAAGVGHIVHLSSAVVYRDWPAGRIDEASPLSDDPESTYRGAKVAMEKRLESLGNSAVILQPTIVWGPGSALWTEAPLRRLKAGGIVLPDPPGRAPLIHVDDLVAAILAAALRQGKGCERFLISGRETVTWRDLFDGYARIAGGGTVLLRPAEDIASRLGPPGPPRGPSALARISAAGRRLLGRRRAERLIGALADMRRAKGPVWPDRGLLALYSASPEVITERAESILGLVPKVTLAAGLDQIAQQLR
ncbi:MAG: hypothetical protein RLZZ528_1231 [Pseudomonadota bacterium]